MILKRLKEMQQANEIEKLLLEKYSHLEKKVHEDTENIFFKLKDGFVAEIVDEGEEIKIARDSCHIIKPINNIINIPKIRKSVIRKIYTQKSYYVKKKSRIIMSFTYGNGEEKVNYETISEASVKLKMTWNQISYALKNNYSIYSIDHDCMVKFKYENANN